MNRGVSLLAVYTLISFTISSLFFPVLIKLLHKWEIFDDPVHHKIHTDFKPSMGGICIMLGVVFTLLISFPFLEWVKLRYFFVGLAIIFITGLRDDILTLDPLRKLVGQILPIFIAVVFGKIMLTSLYEIYPFTFPSWLSWIITIFSIIILTNAYNLIDGIDGLAGAISLVIFLFFGIWFFVGGQYYSSILALSFAGAVMAFLIFNWQPSKIFMGDTGTLAIGFALSFLAISFINFNYSLPQESELRFNASISTAVCVLIVPIFDTLRVIILRLRKLQSPFQADRNHLHHQFLKLGYSHAKTTFIIVGVNLFFILLAWILRNQPDKVILPLIVVLCLAINQAIKIAQRKLIDHASADKLTSGGD